ncbi:MAG: helix-turn-helix transcriptional regulator [bacterium]|nr:helix-turn-helix transcriptional regulator [bacterium]
MKNWKSFKKELLKDKKVLGEYNRLEPKYRLISRVIEMRLQKGITQKQLAKLAGTQQSAIARFEAGAINPTLLFLEKIAEAMKARVVIDLLEKKETGHNSFRTAA